MLFTHYCKEEKLIPCDAILAIIKTIKTDKSE